MTQENATNEVQHAIEKEPDRYTGMSEMNFALTPSVIVCGVAGAVLGLVLAMWVTSEIPIIFAATVVFGVLSGIFGMFVPWFGGK